MKRERVIELWLAGFVLVAGLIVVVVLLGTAAADGPPMSERVPLSFSPIHNLLPTNNVYAFGHLGVVGNIIKRNTFEVDPLCNEQDGCYQYGDGCEERDYYCMGNETGCNYTSSNRHTDGWVDTGNTRWVDVNKCKEKEQKEQEYRDYKCSAGSCNYSINDTKWIDTGIYNTTCNGVSLAPPEITSFAPLSYVDDTVCNWRTFDVTVNQAVNVSWYLNDLLVLTNESVLEAKCTLHAEVVGEHNVTAIASNINGSDMQMWIWDVTELPKECEGTDTSCGIYPNCGNCNEKDGCYPYGDGCEERDYYCMGNETGCNYTSSNRHTDGWVDTGNTRWVDVDKCKEKEQKEQEYRDYKCPAGCCHYSINDTKWIDTGNTSIKANGTICGCTADNTVKRCYDGNCTDTGIGNSSNCSADVACDGKKPGESCGAGRICNSTCNCVSLAPPEITSFAPLSYVDDTVCNWRTFDVTVNQAVNVSWYLNNTLVLTNESVLEAKCTLHAEVVGEHNVTAIASNINGSDMQMWIWDVTELPKECEGTDTSCGIYPNCGNCNEKDGCYPYGDGCEERDYYCMGTEAGCNYTSSNRHTDGWVDTGNTRWVDVDKCEEKEQKEQEYRDYKCSAGCGNYSINDTKWIDTGICSSTCNGVSLAPPEITSFAPLSYVDDTVCNWRTFDVTVSQTANVSWYLNNTLVLTDESVLEAKCTLHAEVVGEHNVTAIASNANGSDMQMWIWEVTSETQTIATGTKTITQTIHVSNSFPLFSNAEYVHFTIGNDNITLTLDDNASFDGVCNLSDLMGRDVSVASTTAELEYFPITYQGVSHDQKWVSAPFFDDVEHKLYLLSGSGLITTLNLEINENSTTTPIPKVAGVGSTVGQFQIVTVAEGSNSNYNRLESNIKGVGYANIYAQYAPDTSYENTPFLPTISQCEKLQVSIDSIISGSESTVAYQVDVLGVANGAEPIPIVSHDWNLSLDLDVEYFPITYQNHTHDQKWAVYPSFDDTEHKLYLLSGSGLITTLDLKINENSTTTPIPKVVGVGSTVGQFQIVTVAEGSNSNYNWLESNIKGVGYANIYAQYAPDTSYENTPFLPTISQCEKLQGSIDSSISGSESKVAYQVDVLGVANGAEHIPIVSHDWNLSLDLDVEYFPITYQNHTHDQKWAVYPSFDDTEHKLYLLSGSGIITASNLEINENSTTAPIPKVVGVGSTVGQFQIVTVAEGSNSNYNRLESNINGVGYANIYAQYAPDTSYEHITFIPTFSQCEQLQLFTDSIGSFIVYDVHVLGLATGVECLMFNGIPLDMVAIDETFDLMYHPVDISGDIFDEKWSVEPEQYEDILVLLRGTGTITELNFIFNDSTAAHPEISSYGYLRGDYNITANILPHYMAVVANGPDVAAMSVLEQGGFGVNFGEGLNCACGDICVDTTGWWRDGGAFHPSDTPIQDAIDNAIAGETICVKDGTYNENVDVNTPLTIQSENGADSTIVNALDPNDHVFEVTADHVNIIGFTVQNASDNAGIYLYNSGYCTISDNTASNNAEGIFINPSSDCTLTNNIASNNDWHGIGLFSSSNCTLTNNIALKNGGRGIGLFNSSDCTLTNNIASSNYVGIKVRNSSTCMLDSNTASDNERGGIGLLSSSDCTVTNNIASSCTSGIILKSSSDCTVTSNTAFNNEIGIGLWGSSNNTLTSNNVSNNILSDFRSADSHGNVVTDLTIASYPTTISFTYDDVGLKGVDTAPSDPEGKVNINKYVNVTGLTANSWIFLNVNYRDGDLGGVDEDSLRMWRYDDGAWTEVSAPNGVNNVENYVYANITGFSIFAPLGNPSGVLKPDLVITGKWLCWPDNCTMCYNVTNIGNGTAPACHNTALYVDDVEVAHDHVPVDLAPEESYIGCFDGYTWAYTPPSDNITVCADNNETVDELDEDNNCLTNIWMCGDVRKDGFVTAWDVAVLNSYVAGIGELEVEQKWAGDVRTDGYITAWDVAVLNSKVAGIGAISCMCTQPDI